MVQHSCNLPNVFRFTGGRDLDSIGIYRQCCPPFVNMTEVDVDEFEGIRLCLKEFSEVFIGVANLARTKYHS